MAECSHPKTADENGADVCCVCGEEVNTDRQLIPVHMYSHYYNRPIQPAVCLFEHKMYNISQMDINFFTDIYRQVFNRTYRGRIKRLFLNIILMFYSPTPRCISFRKFTKR